MISDVLAFFITWTCYGSFLPGNQRGWTKWHKGDQLPQPMLEEWCRRRMSENGALLDPAQREVVEQVVRDHCRIRGWTLHAMNCRSNHCHVVVSATDHSGEQVRDQLKSWATRRLKAYECERMSAGEVCRQRWWSRKGSVRHLFDEESLEAAILYSNAAQDAGGSKANA